MHTIPHLIKDIVDKNTLNNATHYVLSLADAAHPDAEGVRVPTMGGVYTATAKDY